MRAPLTIAACCSAALLVSGCASRNAQEQIKKEVSQITAQDEASLDAIELTVADPNEAVSYFQKKIAKYPDRTDLKRYLAKSLIRANRNDEGVKAWAAVVARPDATSADRVSYADALIRDNKWDQAQQILDSIPPTFESFDRYRLAAMVADSKKQWKKADSFYETAAGLTTTPAGVYNNWGFSKLTRGDYPGAEKLFTRALQYDPNLFTAKNNLVLARGAQRKYDLPIIPMTQTERSQLLYTLALTAIKQGDVATGKGLLQEAIDSNPQYFPAAVRSLNALNANVSN
ncbi:hypothetical protein FGG78_20385 [Thioclava sp. BHET1]|nr:hypothetical protein FGG78_20385 [Thioclava sp. BHET1]